ncbi:MAG: class I SAM-dependent methyltransferase [Planctomycetota bacterium]
MKSIKKLLFGDKQFEGSQAYWEQRYKSGDNSGEGSYGELAQFKADTINAFVKESEIASVVEFGCGDGAQLTLAQYPSYRGYDVAETAVSLCREKHGNDESKSFAVLSEYAGETYDLAMSLDVIYHLVEDEVFAAHLTTVFGAADRLVIVYSSNFDLHSAPHVRHREFTKWIDENISGWSLLQKIDNPYPFDETTKKGSRADFFVYVKTENESDA